MITELAQNQIWGLLFFGLTLVVAYFIVSVVLYFFLKKSKKRSVNKLD